LWHWIADGFWHRPEGSNKAIKHYLKLKNMARSIIIIGAGMAVMVILMLFSSCTDEDEINIPSISTVEITGITQTTAVSGGNIIDDGGAGITARGVCWCLDPNPDIGDSKSEDGTGDGSFTSNITGLDPNTTYHVRAYATNTAGTGYGSEMSFTTLEELTEAVDADGNVYPTVTIGAQEWYAKNLRTTKYKDGTNIPTGHSNFEWTRLSTPAYAIYPHGSFSEFNSNAEVLNAYGALYNWYAVNTGNLCPTGWRVPDDEDWSALASYVGGASVAGGKLKSTRTSPETHPRWDSPNTNAADVYGFSALPGGNRLFSSGVFRDAGGNGGWWSSSQESETNAWSYYMYAYFGDVGRYDVSKNYGNSVRCMRNK
jgi:uncharacterized protein (TIGR02145 family)